MASQTHEDYLLQVKCIKIFIKALHFLQRLNRRLREKSACLNKRLEEISGQMMERVNKQRDWMKNKMIDITKHQQEVQFYSQMKSVIIWNYMQKNS